MPLLSNHHSAETTKLLLLGDPASGKTAALAALANAGYKLNILDLDNGLDILVALVEDKYKENITYFTFTDKLITDGSIFKTKGPPTAFPMAMKALTNWKDSDGVFDLGSIYDWGSDTVFVLDSLTLLGNAIFRHVLYMNSRIGLNKRPKDWGEAMDKQEGFLELLYSTSVKCHVIVNSHITTIGGDNNKDDTDKPALLEGVAGAEVTPAKSFPSALGNKLPPKVGRYFNAMWLVDKRGSGRSTQRIIKTMPTDMLDLRSPDPKNIPAELPLATGLATAFSILRKNAATSTPEKTV